MLGKFPDGAAPAAVLAVDGGNSKTDAVLAGADGRVLGSARIKLSSHFGYGDGDALDSVASAIRAAAGKAGIDAARRPVARVGVFCVAGADLPSDDRRIGRLLTGAGWAHETIVRNDTFAVLRAGTDRGWGVGVVCGSGINCSAVSPTGRRLRFPALGDLSGDQATGGGWIGMAALGAAIRSADRRGPSSALEAAVPAHFGLRRPLAITEAVYRGRMPLSRLFELAPLVFEVAAAGDAVARSILDAVADEVVAMATSSLRRLGMTRLDADVVLGGGVFNSADGSFTDRIANGIHRVAPRARVAKLGAAPVLGALLLGLDQLGAGATSWGHAREQLREGAAAG